MNPLWGMLGAIAIAGIVYGMEENSGRQEICITTDIDGFRLVNIPVLKGQNVSRERVYSIRDCIQKCTQMEPLCPTLVHRTFPNKAQRCEVEGEYHENPHFRNPSIQEGEKRIVMEFREHCHRWITEFSFPVDYWKPWTEWTPCSSSCEGGVRTRQRTCNPDTLSEVYRIDTACASLEREKCNEMSCEKAEQMESDDNDAKRLKQLPFVSKGKRLTARVRRTLNHRVHSINYCIKACNVIGRECVAVSYRRYKNRKIAPECVIYSGDISTGAKLANVPDNEEWQTVQFLDTREVQEWSDWGPCSVTCGEGRMTRSRKGTGTMGNETINFTYERSELCYQDRCWDNWP